MGQNGNTITLSNGKKRSDLPHHPVFGGGLAGLETLWEDATTEEDREHMLLVACGRFAPGGYDD